jgi:hypothetical protein
MRSLSSEISSDAARDRICPFTLNNPLSSKGRRCVAFECMAWRMTNRDQALGYCGLVGQTFEILQSSHLSTKP